LKIVFFTTATGKSPVKIWLRELSREDRKLIGEELKVVEYGLPLGMRVAKKLTPFDVWEVRVQLRDRIARILFTIKNELIFLLHGFIKKSRKTPKEDIEIALKRKRLLS
jgi:phage-related protein